MREFSNSINMVSNLCSRGSTRILGVGKSPRYTQQCQTHSGVVFLSVGLSGFFIWFIASRTLVHISSTNQWMKPHSTALEDDSLFHFGAILRLFSHSFLGLYTVSPLEYNQRTVLTTGLLQFSEWNTKHRTSFKRQVPGKMMTCLHPGQRVGCNYLLYEATGWTRWEVGYVVWIKVDDEMKLLIFLHLSDKRLNEQTGSLIIKRWEVGNVFFPEVSFDFFSGFWFGSTAQHW